MNENEVNCANETVCRETAEAEDCRHADEGRLVIAVLQRGWVVVGRYSQSRDIAKLTAAAVVRRWGTTKGLGELAASGPLANTRLDNCPPITFHVREAVIVMEADENAWRK